MQTTALSWHVPQLIDSRQVPGNVSVDLKTGCRVGGLLSTTQKPLWGQYNFRKTSKAKTAWQLWVTVDTRWEERQLKDWVCLAPLSSGGLTYYSSEIMCRCTSSSSIQWWTMNDFWRLPECIKCFRIQTKVCWNVCTTQVHAGSNWHIIAMHEFTTNT
jgi:hypothetical protein